MSRPSLATILAEDENHQSFVRAYLLRLNLGLRDREIRSERLPNGQGSGEQWVRQQYPHVLRAHRTRAKRARAILLVVVDADTGSVRRRVQQLEEALRQQNMPQRSPGEQIAHLIPKRNVETWILCLNGEKVDEDTDYRGRRGIESQIGAAAGTFYQWSRNNAAIPEHCILSLSAAIVEARRLEP